MLWDSKNFGPQHRAWLLFTLTAAIVAGLIYFYQAGGEGRFPGGGSAVGLSCGVAAGLIFVFEFLLWPRKTSWFRTARWLGKTQTWLHAHLWLGILTLPLIVLHSGFRWGGPFTIAFLSLYGIVFLSGVWGLVLQNILPKLLIDVVPNETVASQLPVVARQLADDAEQILSVCVADAGESRAEEPIDPPSATALQVGARRRVGTILPTQLHPEQTVEKPLPSPEIVRAVREVIHPYLLSGNDSQQVLGTIRKNERYFGELRRVAPPALREVVTILADLCEKRRQLALQERLHGWLHGWMMVHLPLSAALMILLVGHIALALRYN